jgi:hypothetical protein
MKIIDNSITLNELKQLAENMFGDMVKGVVDIERGILAVDAELHADLEAVLLENGSKQNNLWGINLYPQLTGDDFIEFDSMINVRPSQGNKSRLVEDAAVQQKIRAIILQKVRR